MTLCRYDRDTATYLTDDGEECRRDEYGDPTRHCTSRRTCSQHVGHAELTCARCLGRTRTDIRQIVNRSVELLPEAVHVGVDSEAANLAGPAADPEAWSWRKVAAKQGRAWHLSLIEDDDDWHPYTVLTRWAQMLTEDYGDERPEAWTITNAAAYLERVLGKVAQDDGQDWPLFAREIRKCRSHLEAVLRDSLAPERGAPCPTCRDAGTFVRLYREYGHWCLDPDCRRRDHFITDDGDEWRCPRNVDHVWTHERYRSFVEERQKTGA